MMHLFSKTFTILVLWLVAFVAGATAQEGLYVPVANPISTESYKAIKNKIEAVRKDTARIPAKIVLDFNPGGKDSNTADFGACFDLAQYLNGITDIPTVAFVHAKLAGHTVLPVLCCSEVVMSQSASIGEVVPPEAPPLNDFTANGYKALLEQRRSAQLDAIRKLYDARVALVAGTEKSGGTIYVDIARKGEVEKQGVKISDATPLAFAKAGRVGIYTAEQAQKLGLCKTRAETRNEVAELYGISAASLRDDPRGDRPTKAYKLILRGEVDQGKRESVVRAIKDVIRQNGTTLFLQLECAGGDATAARELADELRGFQQNPEEGLLIIAFIPTKAPDTATMVALGCSEIVMTRKSDAKTEEDTQAELGDFEGFLAKGNPAQAQALAQSMRDLATKQGYSPLLAEGMVNKDLIIVRVRKTTDATIRRVITEQEYEAEKQLWQLERVIKPKGQLLKLTATEAEQLGLCRMLVDSKDITVVYEKYGVDAARVKEVTPGIFDRIANFLQIPSVTVLLVVIGFTGLILELKVPGTTIPGIIAAMCFILLFWAHTRFSGQVAILAGLIFMLGLILLLVEVFVIPGFGATGILGVLFMLSGLGLATFDKIPTTAVEWGEFGIKVLTYLCGMMASAGLSILVAKYLPRIPYANKLFVEPPPDASLTTNPEAMVPGASQAMALLGAIGTAVTVLRPAGSVRFGDQYVDVVTDGGYIQAGARVRVIEVESNRIVVKEV